MDVIGKRNFLSVEKRQMLNCYEILIKCLTRNVFIKQSKLSYYSHDSRDNGTVGQHCMILDIREWTASDCAGLLFRVFFSKFNPSPEKI